MKYILIFLLIPGFITAQNGGRLRSYNDPSIAKKSDVLTATNIATAAHAYADSINRQRSADSLALINKFISDSSFNKRRADSIKLDVAARMRIDTANAAIIRMQQQIKTGDSLNLVKLKIDSAAKKFTLDSLATALGGKQATLGFTPYNATNPSGFINSVPAQTWNSITGRPSFATVATSGSYADLSNQPAIPSIAGLLSTATAASTYITSATAASTYQPLLGFTPYNSTNPLGFITSSALGGYATTASVAANYQPVGNYLTSVTAASTYQPLGNYATTAYVNSGDATIKASVDSLKSLQVLKTSGATPTITLAAGAGLGATVSIVGNNIAGKITLNTGASALAIGKIMTLTFANGMTYPNGCTITFVAGDANFAPFMTKLFAVSSTTGIDLSVTATALSVLTTYTGYYHIIGY